MEKNHKNMCYILQIFDSARFMASSLSYLVNNISERVHRIKCKFYLFINLFKVDNNKEILYTKIHIK